MSSDAETFSSNNDPSVDATPVPPQEASKAPESTQAGPTEQTIEAIYEDGVIRPVEPLDLPERTRLSVRLQPQPQPAEPPPAAEAAVPPAAEAAVPPAAEAAPPPAEAAAPQRPASSRVRLLVPLGAALSFGGLSQYMLMAGRTFSWVGVLLYVLALAVAALTITYGNHPQLRASHSADLPPGLRLLRWLMDLPVRPLLLAGSLVATGVLLYALQVEPPLSTYIWTLLLWVLAMALYVAAVVPWQRPRWPPWNRTALQLWWRQHWRLASLLGGIVLLGFVLRFWNVGTIPPTLGGDEGSAGLEAVRVLEGELTNPFVTGWLSNPTMTFYVYNAPAIALFGQTVFALRLPAVLVGSLNVLVTFLLVRRLSGTTTALVTAALLATYHFDIHYSRLAMNNIIAPFSVTLALLFFYRAYEKRSLFDWAMCGIVASVSQYFYFGGRFVVILLISLLVFFAIRDGRRFWRERYREILVMVGAALIAGAPLMQFIYRFPEDYNARVNQVGIFQSGWLEEEQEIQGTGPLPILWDQVKRAGLAFNLYPDRTVWYGTPGPLMDDAMAALFLLGLLYGGLHLGNRRIFPMVAWWGGAMLIGGALTESPPSSQRLITLSVPAIFFVALALVKIGQITVQALNIQRPQRLLVPYLSAAVLALGSISVHWYFVDFTPTRVYGSYNGMVATAIGEYARDNLDEDWRMYFFGPPRMFIGFGTIPYLAPDVEGQDIFEPITEPPGPELIPTDKHAAFIFLPERREELELVRQAYPGGQVIEVQSPVPEQEDPLFILYRVPREQLES